jgi:cob(I)alamin adenosyltransferase
MTAVDTDINQAHREKMARIKAVKDKIYASKTKEKGLLIVHTGTGKGKSTAAFGLVMRTLGHGLKVGVVQFVKGRRETGERQILGKFPEQVTVKVMGEGFTWETQDRERDIEAAKAAWDEAVKMMADPELHLVVMDELNIVLRKDYLPDQGPVFADFRVRQEDQVQPHGHGGAAHQPRVPGSDGAGYICGACHRRGHPAFELCP